MLSVRVAEEDEVGREVEGVEIAAAVGEQRIGQLQTFEAQHLCALGNQMSDAARRPCRVEAGDEHRARLAVGERRNRLRRVPAEAASQMLDILHIQPGDFTSVSG